MTPESRLRLLTDIGADHYVSRDEIRWPARADDPWIDQVWRVYAGQFDRFTGARIDHDFERFRHPAGCWGTVETPPGATVAVVGTGPSLSVHAATLRAVRERLLIVTSPGGAAALATHGIAANLVVVEYPSTAEADLSIAHPAGNGSTAPPWVASALNTPAALLKTATADRVFVPHSWPGWGCWPATAVALALSGGARLVCLVGIEPGTPSDAEASHATEFARMGALLTLLAQTGKADCVDGGGDGAIWPPAELTSLAPEQPVPPLRVDTWPIDARYSLDEAARWRDRSETLVVRARQALAMAAAVRDGADPAMAQLAARMMLAWGHDPALRTGLQEMLGLTVLPRLWRAGIERTPLTQVWRPVVVALRELVWQADRLDERLARHATGGAAALLEIA